MTDIGTQEGKPSRRSIRARLIRGFVLILLLVITSVLANIWAVTQLNRANTTVLVEGQRVTTSLELAHASAELVAAFSAIAPTQDSDYMTQIVEPSRARVADAQAELEAAIQDLPRNDSVRLLVAQILLRTSHMDSYADLIVPSAQAGNWDNVRFYQTQLRSDYELRVAAAVQDVRALTEQRQRDAIVDAATVRFLAVIIPTGLSMVALIVAAITVFAIVRGITEPVGTLVEAATLLAAGNLEKRVPIERGDEFGEIAVAFNEMSRRLQRLYEEMEEIVAERTQALQDTNLALQRRASQMEASAEVARSVASIFQLDQLLRQTVDLIRDKFGFYHAGIFLIDETGQWAVLQEATGEAGAQMKDRGHKLQVAETSMVGWTALHHRPRITQHVGEDEIRYAHPLLPDTRSEMCLPLMFGGKTLGVLNVQSAEADAFDDNDIRALQSMADQIAVAIDNARRLSEEASLLEATSPIYRVGRRLTTATSVDDVADSIVDSVAETGVDGCVLIEFELDPNDVPETLSYLRVWRRDREPVFQPGLRLSMEHSPFPLEMIGTLWTSSDIRIDDNIPDSARQVFEETGVRSLANIPLRSGEKVIGQVVALRTVPGRFTDATMRFYEAWSDQVAVALERARLADQTQRRAEHEQIIRQISDRMQQATDIDMLMRIAVDELHKELGTSRGFVRLGTSEQPTGKGRENRSDELENEQEQAAQAIDS
jgi:GAF domain-containing protein/HAMP domain-containing protein